MDRAIYFADSYFNFVPSQVGWAAGKKVNECKKKANANKETIKNGTETEETVETLTPDPGKREREPTLSFVEASSFKPIRKKPMTCAYTCTQSREKKKKQRRARPEAVLIKPAEGSCYVEILKDLKRKVKSDTLGVKFRGVREARNGETLIEVGPAADDRRKLRSAIRRQSVLELPCTCSFHARRSRSWTLT